MHILCKSCSCFVRPLGIWAFDAGSDIMHRVSNTRITAWLQKKFPFKTCTLMEQKAQICFIIKLKKIY